MQALQQRLEGCQQQVVGALAQAVEPVADGGGELGQWRDTDNRWPMITPVFKSPRGPFYPTD